MLVIVLPLVLPSGFAVCSAGLILLHFLPVLFCRRLCRAKVLPQDLPGVFFSKFAKKVLPRRFAAGLPGLFCSKFAKGFAKGFCRRICRGYFALSLPKVLPRGFTAGSAGDILL